MTSLTPAHIEAKIQAAEYATFGTLTVCILTLENGHRVVGASGCIDPARFDEDTGRFYAYDDAVRQVFELEGYLLKQRLYEESRRG